MRLENVFVILKLEYLQRIRNKGFWIATLAIPLFAGAMTTLPSLLLLKSHTNQTIVVVDATGRGVGEALKTQVEKAKAAAKPEPKPKSSAPARKMPGEKESRMADFVIETQ